MSTKTKNKKARRDSDSDGDSMFASDSSTSLSVPFSEQDKKRRRLNGNNPDGAKGKNGDTGVPGPAVRNRTVDPALLEQAKLRLSKFAARLFDPNRIKVRTPVDLFSDIVSNRTGIRYVPYKVAFVSIELLEMNWPEIDKETFLTFALSVVFLIVALSF